MKTQFLGVSDLQVTRIAYGCLKLGGSLDRSALTIETSTEALKSIRAVLDSGINFFDHADIYRMGKSEEAFSKIWQEVPNLRNKIFLQTKCGIRFPCDRDSVSQYIYDFSYEHIIQTVNSSLKRLRTDYLDVLLLHRPDPLIEPEEVARAFDELHQAGKVRWFGVSNHTAAQIRLLSQYVHQPIITNQIAYNILHTHILDAGIIFNQNNPKFAQNEGIIEYCRENNIALQSWGSLAWGLLSGHKPEGHIHPTKNILDASKVVAEIGKQKNVSPESILVSWILRHPANIIAVIGTTNPERIKASCMGDAVQLSREEWYRIFIAGRGEELP